MAESASGGRVRIDTVHQGDPVSEHGGVYHINRPCFFPVQVVDLKGRVKKKYPYKEVMTPYERLKSLPKLETYLAPGVTIPKLEVTARAMSDDEFAERMVNARSDLFQRISVGQAGPPKPETKLIHISTLSTKKEKVAKRKKGL